MDIQPFCLFQVLFLAPVILASRGCSDCCYAGVCMVFLLVFVVVVDVPVSCFHVEALVEEIDLEIQHSSLMMIVA